MGNHVLVDETFIEGKDKTKHADKKLHSRLSSVGKVASVGIRGANL
jgi:hypothetical protein